MIAVSIPAYRVRDHVLKVIAQIGPEVSRIYVVDDACPEGSGKHVQAQCRDPRVRVLFHSSNQGVGGATLTGFSQAARDGASILVKVDGDGQMPTERISTLVRPIQEGHCDYSKGNRFYSLDFLEGMPTLRLIGNSALSLVSKISTGYWRMMDPNNGFVAIHTRVFLELPVDKIDRRYFFESDMLFRLNTVRAVVRDMPMKAKYAGEKSSLSIAGALPNFAWKHSVRTVKRLIYNYFVRDFNLASVEMVFAFLFVFGGAAFGISQWIHNSVLGQVTPAGTVMLAVTPILVGFQLLLAAINYDILSEPRTPLHSQL